jgi:hypothetical protein
MWDLPTALQRAFAEERRPSLVQLSRLSSRPVLILYRRTKIQQPLSDMPVRRLAARPWVPWLDRRRPPKCGEQSLVPDVEAQHVCVPSQEP